MWLASGRRATHLKFDGAIVGEILGTYDEGSCLTCGSHALNYDDLAIAPDGKAWLLSRGSDIVSLDPESGLWGKTDCCNALISTMRMEYPDFWVGTDSAGVALFRRLAGDDAEPVQFDMSDGLPSNNVRSIAVDPEGVLWVGTDQGIASCVLPK